MPLTKPPVVPLLDLSRIPVPPSDQPLPKLDPLQDTLDATDSSDITADTVSADDNYHSDGAASDAISDPDANDHANTELHSSLRIAGDLRIRMGELSGVRLGYRPWRDVTFTAIYLIAMAATIASSLVTQPVSLDLQAILSANASDMYYLYLHRAVAALKSSAGVFMIMTLVSTGVGIFWLHLLQQHTKTMVFLTIVLSPVLCSVVGLVLVLHSQIIGVIPFVISLVIVLVAFCTRRRARVAITVLEAMSKILQANYAIFHTSIIILLSYIVFTAMVFALFLPTILMGYWRMDSEGLNWWIPDRGAIALQLFIVVMFLWTSSLVAQVQRFVVSTITAVWFFHRNEELHVKPSLWAVRKALSTSFGTLCFGSLTLPLAQIGTTIIRYTNYGWQKCCGIELMTCNFSKTIASVNQFGITYSSFNGDALCAACRTADEVFARTPPAYYNTVDWLAKMIAFMFSLMLAVIAGFLSFLYAYVRASPQDYTQSMGIMNFAICMLIMSRLTDIVPHTLDAMYMCYTIDRKYDQVHSEEVHRLFGTLRNDSADV